jgi:hypothetical protein
MDSSIADRAMSTVKVDIDAELVCDCELESAGGKAPRVIVESVRLWEGYEPRRLDPVDDRSTIDAEASRADPVWIEMRLRSNPENWVNPWEDYKYAADWSAVAEVAGGVGFPLPDGARGRDPVATVLHRLPNINELGQLRWLERELDRPVFALPLAGFRPSETLPARNEGFQKVEQFEFVLTRVNMAVIDRYVFTIRLPDRLCSGARRSESRRIAACKHYARHRLPGLHDMSRYIGAPKHPTSADLGEAIALYLSASCACVPEYAGRWASAIEGKLIQTRTHHRVRAMKIEADRVEGHFEDVFAIRGALSIAEEELERLHQRQRDAEISEKGLQTVRARYASVLEQVRATQGELQRLGERLTKRHDDHQNRQAFRRQLVLAIFATFVIVPTLVASLMKDDNKLPNPDSELSFFGMISLMLGLGGGVMFLISRSFGEHETEHGESQSSIWAHPLTAALSVGLVVAGVLLSWIIPH